MYSSEVTILWSYIGSTAVPIVTDAMFSKNVCPVWLSCSHCCHVLEVHRTGLQSFPGTQAYIDLIWSTNTENNPSDFLLNKNNLGNYFFLLVNESIWCFQWYNREIYIIPWSMRAHGYAGVVFAQARKPNSLHRCLQSIIAELSFGQSFQLGLLSQLNTWGTNKL